MLSDLGPLAGDRRVDIGNGVALGSQEPSDVREEGNTGNPLVCWIRIWEMFPYVTQGGRAQARIRNGM